MPSKDYSNITTFKLETTKSLNISSVCTSAVLLQIKWKKQSEIEIKK